MKEKAKEGEKRNGCCNLNEGRHEDWEREEDMNGGAPCTIAIEEKERATEELSFLSATEHESLGLFLSLG